jgi:Mg2+ and Co2+ transporter CorA
MVSIQEALQSALRFAKEALGDSRTEQIRLEEVESKVIDGKDYWLVTFRTPDPAR